MINYFKNKKALGPVVATALLLVVAVASIMGFQSWFQTYQSNLNSDVEIKSNSNLGNTQIETLVGDILYFKNGGNDNITITSVKIDGFDCNITGNYSNGMQPLNISSCVGNITTSSPEIVVFTNNGIFQEKIYIKDLSIYQIIPISLEVPTDGLIHEYLFDGNSLDTIGNIDGVNTAITYSNSNLGQSANFVSTSRVEFTNLYLNQTLSFWVNLKSKTDRCTIFMDDLGGKVIYLCRVPYDYIIWNNANTAKTTAQIIPNINQWYHLTFTDTGSAIKIYLDGVEVINTAPSYVSMINMDIGFLGSYSATVELDGYLDNMRLYDRVLTEQEILNLYNEGTY